jgi:hypothetical protein
VPGKSFTILFVNYLIVYAARKVTDTSSILMPFRKIDMNSWMRQAQHDAASSNEINFFPFPCPPLSAGYAKNPSRKLKQTPRRCCIFTSSPRNQTAVQQFMMLPFLDGAFRANNISTLLLAPYSFPNFTHMLEQRRAYQDKCRDNEIMKCECRMQRKG